MRCRDAIIHDTTMDIAGFRRATSRHGCATAWHRKPQRSTPRARDSDFATYQILPSPPCHQPSPPVSPPNRRPLRPAAVALFATTDPRDRQQINVAFATLTPERAAGLPRVDRRPALSTPARPRAKSCPSRPPTLASPASAWGHSGRPSRMRHVGRQLFDYAPINPARTRRWQGLVGALWTFTI